MADVRVYQKEDEAGLIELWKEVFPGGAPHNDPLLSLRKKLEVDSDLLLVAVETGEIVGSVMGGYDGHRGWLYSLAVKGRSRGRGIGTLLVNSMIAELEAQGCVKVNLQVRSSNRGVIAFYQKLGFSVEEHISMGRLLIEPGD